MSKLTRVMMGLLALGLSTSAFAQSDEAVLVPEPGTLGLLLAGVAGLLVARRSGRK